MKTSLWQIEEGGAAQVDDEQTTTGTQTWCRVDVSTLSIGHIIKYKRKDGDR